MYIVNFLYFLWGLIFGSFINVIIYRLPHNLSIIKPRSFCPNCKYSIPLYKNIPIISYIIQFGKCSNCNCKIPIIYPIVEFSIGMIWLFGSIYFNIFNDILYYSIIASILLSICFIDYKHFIVPLELSIFCLLFIMINLSLNGSLISHLDGLILGTGYLSIIFLVTWVITRRQSLGLGDIQLTLVLGIWLGDYRILLVIFISAFIALIYWLLISMLDKLDNNRMLPFGSFLSIVTILIYPFDFSNVDLTIFL